MAQQRRQEQHDPGREGDRGTQQPERQGEKRNPGRGEPEPETGGRRGVAEEERRGE